MANTIQSLKWSDVAVPAGFVSQYKRFFGSIRGEIETEVRNGS